MNTSAIDALGMKLGQAALNTLVRICPEVRSASKEQLNTACAAMRSKSVQAVDDLMANANATPWIAEPAFQLAVLTIAQEGAQTLRQN